METIVEFRAGLMVLADGRLVADTRKGVIRVAQVRTTGGESAGKSQTDSILPGPNRLGLPAAAAHLPSACAAVGACRMRRAWPTSAGTRGMLPGQL